METSTTPSAAITFSQTIPIVRIFDVAKALEYYVDYLGFTVDWEHRFEPGLPLYMQVSRGGLILHLSEHHGDATPGSNAVIELTGLDAFCDELCAKKNMTMRAGISEEPWGRAMQLIDPFGNRLRFLERSHG